MHLISSSENCKSILHFKGSDCICYSISINASCWNRNRNENKNRQIRWKVNNTQLNRDFSLETKLSSFIEYPERFCGVELCLMNAIQFDASTFSLFSLDIHLWAQNRDRDFFSVTILLGQICRFISQARTQKFTLIFMSWPYIRTNEPKMHFIR